MALRIGLTLLFGWLLGCSSQPAEPPTPTARRSVLFIGLDGADWQFLDPLIARGAMPNLAALVAAGRPGVLHTLNPPLSPLVWTTMMTGVSPLAHGILDFTRFAPGSGVREPITSDERQVPAVWNWASDAGRKVAVLGMWATYPTEPIHGMMVADRFCSFASRDLVPPPHSVHPPADEAWARQELARLESAVDHEALKVYLPGLSAAEFAQAQAATEPYTQPVSALRRILIETRLYHALARYALQRHDPDLLIVYFQGTDTIGHVFAPYAPPRQLTVSEPDFARFQGVPERYFAEIDRVLGDLRDLAQERGSVLFLASDHGFHWSEGRPTQVESLAAATAGRWHREQGMSLLWGPGLAASAERPSASVDQVAGTLLALLGLPPHPSMASPPLGGVTALLATMNSKAQQPLASPPPQPAPADANAAALSQLRSLGYLGSAEPATRKAPGHATRTPGAYNNAGILLRDAHRPAEAAQAFTQALELDPGHASALVNLSDLLFREDPGSTRAQQLLLSALAAGLPEGGRQVVLRARALERAGKIELSLNLLAAALEQLPMAAELWLLRGRYLLERQACREARGHFKHAVALTPQDPVAFASLGLACVCAGDPRSAEAAFRRSLELDPDQPELRAALDPERTRAGRTDAGRNGASRKP